MKNWKLELKLTLQSVCFISIAKSLWNQADTKMKIKHFPQKQLQHNWFHVENYVLSKVNKIGLPGALRSELELAIVLLGDKIRGWLEFLVNTLSLDVSYAMNIPWTPHGTINQTNFTFQRKNIKIGNSHRLWKAAMDMEAERCPYMRMNEVGQEKNALHFINEICKFHQLINQERFLASEFDYFDTALILAINKLSENELELFVKQHPTDILEFYLLNYGFQKSFHLAFRNVEEFLTPECYCDLFFAISKKEVFLASSKSAAIYIRQNFVESAFSLLWTEIPLEKKKKLIIDKALWDVLVSMSDTVIWKLIFNDKNLQCYKNDMHSILVSALCSRLPCTTAYWLIQTNFDPIKVKDLNFFETIICDGDFYSAELLAFLLGYSDEEMINVKSRLNSCRICQNFVEKRQWDAIDKYLKWRFDSEQVAKIFKNRYKTNDFICKIILQIWNEHDMLTAFLFWLFESEENIVKYKVENPGIAEVVIQRELFYQKRKKTESIPHFEAFLKYWLLSSEQMSLLKEYIAKHVD